MPFVVAHRQRRLRRLQPSPRHHSADHSPVPMVNRDASRFFAGRDIGGRARHVITGRDGSADSAGRPRVGPRLSPAGRIHRRSKYGRDHNGCRSPPEYDSAHKGTVAPGSGRPDQFDMAAHDGCGKSCDPAPACVPRHGVVHGAEAKPGSWARHRACRRWCGPGAVSTSHLNPDLSSSDPGAPRRAQRRSQRLSRLLRPRMNLRSELTLNWNVAIYAPIATAIDTVARD